jgi:hypothetical protein
MTRYKLVTLRQFGSVHSFGVPISRLVLVNQRRRSAFHIAYGRDVSQSHPARAALITPCGTTGAGGRGRNAGSSLKECDHRGTVQRIRRLATSLGNLSSSGRVAGWAVSDTDPPVPGAVSRKCDGQVTHHVRSRESGQPVPVTASRQRDGQVDCLMQREDRGQEPTTLTGPGQQLDDRGFAPLT